MPQLSRFQWFHFTFALLSLSSLPSAVARPSRGGGGGVEVDVDFTIQLGGPTNVTSFSFYIIFAILFAFCSLPVYRNFASHNQYVRGWHYSIILLSAVFVTTYNILGAVWMSQDPPRDYAFVVHDPSEVVNLTPSFYASLGAVDELGDLFLFLGILALLDHRMGAYLPPTQEMALLRIKKRLVDAVFLLGVVICLVLVAADTAGFQKGYQVGQAFDYIPFWLLLTREAYVIDLSTESFVGKLLNTVNKGRAYSAFYVLLVLDVVITSVILWKRHVKGKLVVDPVLTNIAIYTSPPLLGRALFQIIICFIESPVDKAFIPIADIVLADVIIDGVLYVVVFAAVINAGAISYRDFGGEADLEKEASSRAA